MTKTELPPRKKMIEFLVEHAYPGVLRRQCSYARMFRAELEDQSLHIIVLLYESALKKKEARAAARALRNDRDPVVRK